MKLYTDEKLKNKLMTLEEKAHFTARHIYRTEIGANPDFLGKGVTKWKSGSQKYGTVETLTLPKNPQSIVELKRAGKIRLISNQP